MADEIDEMWKHLKLTEDEEAYVIEEVTLLEKEDDGVKPWLAADVIESGIFPYGAWLCASPLKRKREAVGSEAFKQVGKCLGFKEVCSPTISEGKSINIALFLNVESGRRINRKSLAMVVAGDDMANREVVGSGFKARNKEIIADIVGDNIAGFVEQERSHFGEKLKYGGLSNAKAIHEEVNEVLGRSLGLTPTGLVTKEAARAQEKSPMSFQFQAARQQAEQAISSTSRTTGSRCKKLMP
ncbi:hypothetical protein COLO4_13662 [Corchorus olitorius]|uniref:Uncharacterized protein n=1 Tax=Corchorus olitorius TaxID=93759 RepID=A0A1R3JVR7_9ROSI|nr:hypothetical protein COLO4_13662 [Corchorus olitorius]